MEFSLPDSWWFGWWLIVDSWWKLNTNYPLPPPPKLTHLYLQTATTRKPPRRERRTDAQIVWWKVGVHITTAAAQVHSSTGGNGLLSVRNLSCAGVQQPCESIWTRRIEHSCQANCWGRRFIKQVLRYLGEKEENSFVEDDGVAVLSLVDD